MLVKGLNIKYVVCRIVLAVMACYGSGVAHAEYRGLFWSISKDEHTVYALGSVHLANKSFYPMPANIMAAFDKADELVVEVDDSLISAEEQQALLMKYALYPPGQNIYTQLAPSVLDQISMLLAEFDQPLKRFAQYKPGMIGVTLSALQGQKMGFSADQGLDRYFLQKARYKKSIRQAEDFEFQMQLIGALPADNAILRDAFVDMADYEDMWTEMMQNWKDGDAEAMYETTIATALRDFPTLNPYYETLFFDRHPRMEAAIEDCFSAKKVCFVLYGAGHFLGERGVLAGLKKQGYLVKQL